MAKRKKVEKVKERLTIDEAKEVVREVKESDKSKVNSKNRVKITTMINPALRDELKILAIKRGVKFSDLLESALSDFLHLNK